jgi:hypothetical protein
VARAQHQNGTQRQPAANTMDNNRTGEVIKGITKS